MTLRIIFFGPPGSGKGTQSEKLEAEYGLAHFSTGDALRAEIRNNTPLGQKVKAITEAGKLVDDDTIMDVVRSYLTSLPKDKGVIFDGIPRTIGQAKKLSALLEDLGLPVTHILYLTVDREELKTRICGRLFHPGSGRTYHKKFRPPKVDMKDDITGEDLIIRRDDTEEVFEERMKQYEDTFQTVIDYYKTSGLVKEIDGNSGTPDEIYAKIKSLL